MEIRTPDGPVPSPSEVDLDNTVTIRYNGMVSIYDIRIGPGDNEAEDRIPVEVRQRGVLRALRAIFEVPEGESLLAHSVMVARQWKAGKDQHKPQQFNIPPLINPEGNRG